MPLDSTDWPAVGDNNMSRLLRRHAASFSCRGEGGRRWLAVESSGKMLVYSHPAARVLRAIKGD